MCCCFFLAQRCMSNIRFSAEFNICRKLRFEWHTVAESRSFVPGSSVKSLVISPSSHQDNGLCRKLLWVRQLSTTKGFALKAVIYLFFSFLFKLKSWSMLIVICFSFVLSFWFLFIQPLGDDISLREYCALR